MRASFRGIADCDAYDWSPFGDGRGVALVNATHELVTFLAMSLHAQASAADGEATANTDADASS